MTFISYILPTRNRPDALATTLAKLGDLPRPEHELAGGAEVIVVDNASDPSASIPCRLNNGLPIALIRRCTNDGAAARNLAAKLARGQWLVMLDDDSHPLDCGHLHALAGAPAEVAAIGADIRLPDGSREAGGLPEVFIGCGVAIRRDAFLDAGGYDPSFHYYAEEYDLCAKLILRGGRIIHDSSFRVLHEKLRTGRDMNLIVRRLVRNNGWVAQRYAPCRRRRAEIRRAILRYARIAMKESATVGYARGLMELIRTLHQQTRRDMSDDLFDRFTGLSHARGTFAREPALQNGAKVFITDAGKNASEIERALRQVGAQPVKRESDADAIVIGTLSPGPMLDAWEKFEASGKPVVRPWSPLVREPSERAIARRLAG